MNESLKRILVIEDNPEDAEVFRHYLERDSEGFTCTIAISGDAGLKLMSECEFDCVLLDQGLPGLSGLEILAAFAASGLPCAVVMLTGVGDERLAVAAMRMGAEDYLNKNHLTRERLGQVVNNALKSFDLRRRLEREQHRNEAILASISDAFFAFDREWNFTYVNPTGQQLMGRSADGLIGQNLWNVVPEMRDTVFETGLQRATESATPSTFEALFLSRQRWLEVRVYPTKSSVSVYAADITNRKRDEERRRLLETVALSANDAIIITQAEPKEEPGPRILYVNPAFEALSGYTAAEVLGRSPRFLQGPGSSRETLDVIRDALKAWQPVQAEVLNYRKDGTSFWVELSIAPVADASGSFTHWVSVQRDVTERKANEQLLRRNAETFSSLVKDAPFGVYVIDADFCIAQVSVGAVRNFGSVSSLLGRDLAEVLRLIWAEPFATVAISKFRATLATGEPYIAVSTEQREDRAAIESYDWRIERITLPDGSWGVVCYFHDVTVQQATTRQLEQINEAQQRFVSDAAHELRAPLTSIRGNLSLLRRYPDIADEERREMLTDAERETTRLTRLIADLLTVARGEVREEIEPERVALEQSLEAAWRTVRSLSERRRFDLGTLQPMVVLGDPDALQQLFLILLENALKYSPEDGVVRLEALECEGWAEVRVFNDGTGIAPDELERVFERFYRTDRARSRSGGATGTGLGLTIARQIVERFGGRVWLESEGGRGTTAVVRLPRQASESAQ